MQKATTTTFLRPGNSVKNPELLLGVPEENTDNVYKVILRIITKDEPQGKISLVGFICIFSRRLLDDHVNVETVAAMMVSECGTADGMKICMGNMSTRR